MTVADSLGLSGRSLSHFRVYEPLGAGGMGAVYRAEDVTLGRTVALKFMLPDYTVDDSAAARFLREARSVAALDHPNVCTVYEAGRTEEGQLFLAMSYYAGETLKDRITSRAAMPIEDALDIAGQMTRGLGCAHAAGIVHRDLKPANVMLTSDGSLGVVLYEMLTGQHPSRGDDVSGTLTREIVARHPGPLPPAVTTSARQLVERLLRRDPAQRISERGRTAARPDDASHARHRGVDTIRGRRQACERPGRPTNSVRVRRRRGGTGCEPARGRLVEADCQRS